MKTAFAATAHQTETSGQGRTTLIAIQLGNFAVAERSSTNGFQQPSTRQQGQIRYFSENS